MRSDFKLVNGRVFEQLAVSCYTFHHRLAKLFFHGLLHNFSYKFKVAFIGYVEFYFVPDVWKQRPTVVINRRAESFGVGKFDEPSARMIGRKVLPAELPKRGVQIAHVNHVARGVAYLYAVADPV